jgi:hypothetical protein
MVARALRTFMMLRGRSLMARTIASNQSNTLAVNEVWVLSRGNLMRSFGYEKGNRNSRWWRVHAKGRACP